MNKKTAVYIGRFQIFHNGHLECLKHATENYDHIILLIGSSYIARNPKNPFTYEERHSVLNNVLSTLSSECNKNIQYSILPLTDSIYNNTKWLQEVQSQVLSVSTSKDITVIGSRKEGDSSTEYLNYFPQWKMDLIDSVGMINSTELRTKYFQQFSTEIIDDSLPIYTKQFLQDFICTQSEIYASLQRENAYIENYKKQMYSTLPYKNIPFLTGDALVVSSGNILLIKRKTEPGKGLLALPGGFFDAWNDLDQVQTAIRELQEETGIKVPEKVLRGNIQSTTEFGDPNRSLRWRIITKVTHIQLPDKSLPKVKGSDDAEKAFWMPLGDVISNRDKFFEDHFDIIQTILKL